MQAKGLALECSVKETNGKSISDVTNRGSAAVMIEQPIKFDPVLASTPQNSPPSKKGIDLAYSMFDDAFKNELSISLTEVQNSDLSPLLEDKYSNISLHEITEELSHDRVIVCKDVSSVPARTPRPKRHCTELTTSYAEDDLAR